VIHRGDRNLEANPSGCAEKPNDSSSETAERGGELREVTAELGVAFLWGSVMVGSG